MEKIDFISAQFHCDRFDCWDDNEYEDNYDSSSSLNW